MTAIEFILMLEMSKVKDLNRTLVMEERDEERCDKRKKMADNCWNLKQRNSTKHSLKGNK